MQIIDNLFTDEEQNNIENVLLGPNTGWIYSKSISYKNNPEVSKSHVDKFMSFSRPVFANNQVLDNNINLYFGILNKLKDIISIQEILNIRSHLQLPLVEQPPATVHVDNHTIDNYDYKVCLYYVNDSDGDTLIFDQSVRNLPVDKKDDSQLTIKHRVQPKRGRIIIFDGDLYHCSGRPTKNQRCVINYNVR